LTEDIEKTHYSYDLISGFGSTADFRHLACSTEFANLAPISGAPLVLDKRSVDAQKRGEA
jgi:hypothetical protein